ncbi:MAG: tripartite tricarboxylate transporter substrate binding protein [Burkholderiales bacterium]
MKCLLVALSVVASLALPVKADTFPSRPISIIVSVAPGGTLDTLARLIAMSLGKALKQSVVVENVTGAGGLIGFQKLLKSEPNGYTLMFSNNSMVLVPLLNPKSEIDVVRDVVPIGAVANVPMVLGVSNKSGIQDLPELLRKLKSGELKPDLGSGGPGTTAHLAEAMFLQMSGGQGELIQYRGSGPAITDLVAGRIDAVIDQTVTLMPLNAEKRVRAIAVTGDKRTKQMPDVPTFTEGGLGQFNLQIWNGLVAPKGTPKQVIDVLSKALAKAIEAPEFKDRVEQWDAALPDMADRTPEGLAKIVAREQKSFAELSKSIDLQAR